MTETTTTRRYIVQRYRASEAAPSLSMGAVAESPRDALRAHFQRYGGGVADGTWYTVLCHPTRAYFGTAEAREVAREAMR